jgi:hypothetical protein
VAEIRKWKVVRRKRKPADGTQLVGSWGRPILIAGPFESMAAALNWIEAHPEEGAGLTASPIILGR